MLKKPQKASREDSSFRDPSGTVYYQNGKVLRQVNRVYKENFDFFEQKLSQYLTSNNLLLGYTKSHQPKLDNNAYLILEVPKIPFISYPYEWTFSQLKDAALLTLKIQKAALEHSMTLKDASAYNVQFIGSQPIFIDHLSFEKFNSLPWVGYKQFCQHFLSPLLLMSKVDIRLNSLLKNYIDGIPLDLASKLLPKKTYLNLAVFSHIHLHSRNQKKYSNSKTQTARQLKKTNQLAIIDSLESLIKNLKPKITSTEWGDYYTFTNYSKKSFNEKKLLVKKYINKINAQTVIDLGANNGEFSRISSAKKIYTVSFDIDPVAVEKNYQKAASKNDKFILPLILDLTNPSPAIGWDLTERKSALARSSADVVLALALIHHICISNNVPFYKFAKLLSSLGKYLIIEFIPKTDSKVKQLLSTREDIFNEYKITNFEADFAKYFTILQKDKIKNTHRTLYLLKQK